jgi:hypothetical protein
MEYEKLVDELIVQLRRRPYATLACVLGVGWLIGRTIPLRGVVALAGVGARAALSSGLDSAVRGGFRGR